MWLNIVVTSLRVHTLCLSESPCLSGSKPRRGLKLESSVCYLAVQSRKSNGIYYLWYRHADIWEG